MYVLKDTDGGNTLKKRLIAGISMMLTAAFVISGCGSTKNNSSSVDDKDKDTFVIGQIASLTGDVSNKGVDANKGAQAAVNEINNAGGVKVGDDVFKLRLTVADDENNADTAKNAYNTLKDKKIDTLIAPISAESCKAIEQTSNSDNIPMIISSVTQNDISRYDNEFRICFSNKQEGTSIADYVKTQYEQEGVNAAVLYEDKYSELAENFINQLQNAGGTLIAREVYPDGEKEISRQLRDLENTRPDVIFVPADKEWAVEILNSIEQLGIKTKVIGNTDWKGIEEGLPQLHNISDVAYLSLTDRDQAFKSTYISKYNIKNVKAAEEGYDSVYVIKSALEEAGSIDKDLQICALTKIKYDGITGNSISFNDDGENQKTAEFKVVYKEVVEEKEVRSRKSRR